MKIRKVTIGLALLMYDSDEKHLSNLSLARIAAEMDCGDLATPRQRSHQYDTPHHQPGPDAVAR